MDATLQTGPGTKRVAIIGAGFGGIAAAVSLQRAGITRFTVYERSPATGGTWLDNRYPGAATDAASHIYSFSFAPYDWPRTHMDHKALQAYAEHVVDRCGLRKHLRTGAAVVSAYWDEARRCYVVTLADGTRDEVDAVISAVGLFARANWPDWPGLADFRGDVVHTAHWDDRIDLKGKRVAVVGTGSSAAQVVPAIADHVASLTLFQREPGWLLPKADRDFKTWERSLLKLWPLQKLYRLKLYLRQEIREWNGAFFKPGAWSYEKAKETALAYIDEVFAGRPDLKEAVTPRYPFYGKRAVISSDFYPALTKPNVTLVPRAVREVTPTALVDAAGGVHEADVIILCTGFAVQDYVSTFRLTGRGGVTLAERWSGEPEAFAGVMVDGFPNFFMIYGPNTNGGFIISNLEWQARFAALEIRRLADRGLATVEVTPDAVARYNAWLKTRLAGTSFSAGNNYFKSASGRITTQWPDNATQYAARLEWLRRFGGWRAG
jgi:cation diffusion facilitator CzcD-associated flavoprotein CzcO